MTGLNTAAKAALRAHGVSQIAWARKWFPCNAKPGDLSTEIGRPAWLGDACGCPDDRCIGYHHDGPDDCGCLPVLLEQLGREAEAEKLAAWLEGPTARNVVMAAVRPFIDQVVAGERDRIRQLALAEADKAAGRGLTAADDALAEAFRAFANLLRDGAS